MKSTTTGCVAGLVAAGLIALASAALEVQPTPPPASPADSEPSACFTRLKAGLADVRALPSIGEPSGCIAEDVVNLAAIRLPDGQRITLAPSAMLRCEFAETLVHWIREDVAGVLAKARTDIGDARMTTLHEVSSFECRLRNRQAEGRISEHGLANAIDIRGIGFADGRRIDFTDVNVPVDLRMRLREGACARFTTVLGPGSDGAHESHIHFDLAQRRNNYRLCQWDVRAPGEGTVAATSLPPLLPPLPRPRPAQAPARAF